MKVRYSVSLLLSHQLRPVQCFHYPRISGDFSENLAKTEQKKLGPRSDKALNLSFINSRKELFECHFSNSKTE